MKRKIIILIVFIANISLCFCETSLWEKFGKISCGSWPYMVNTDTDWSIKLSCEDEKGILVNNICYIVEGETAKIEYDSANVAGYNEREGSSNNTSLEIISSDKNTYSDSFSVENGKSYRIIVSDKENIYL